MKEKFIKIWKDPVGSKLISAGIIGLLVLIFNTVYSIFSDLNFETVTARFFHYDIKLWIVLLTIIIILIALGIYNYFKKPENENYEYNESSLELDRELFNRIRNELITYDSIRWIRTNNFAGYSFRDQLLNPFDNLEHEANNPDFEFLNPNLEFYKKGLITAIRDFNSFSLPNIFSEGVDRLSVPSEWELQQPERFNAAVRGIHERAQIIGAKYDEFIKQGRRILSV